MAYSLTAAQIAALTAERDQLQTTVNTYDSTAFIDATNTGITAANEVDEATLRVWTSAVQSTDGTQPRETVLSQLNGLTPNRSVVFEDMNDDQPLYNMGAIQPVIDQITDAVTSNALNVESSRRIRLTLNRYYPDVDNKDDNPASDTRNVFPDNPWFAYAVVTPPATTPPGELKDYQDLNTLFQAGVFGEGGRGTPAMIMGNGPDPAGIDAGIEATGANAQTSFQSIEMVDGNTVPVTIGDNESFFIYMGNYLSTAHSGASIPAGSDNSSSNVINLDIRGTTVAGTMTITSENSVDGTSGNPPATDPDTYSPAVDDILNISVSGGTSTIRVVQSSPGTAMCANSGTTIITRTCTRASNIRYIVLNQTDPANGTDNVASGSQGAQGTTGTKREDFLNLKRFTMAILAGPTNIATPAINSQQNVSDERNVIIGQLGTQTSLIYQQKYNIANTRCNWNNGTLSALISRENSRLNLFSPVNLQSQGIIDPTTGVVVDPSNFTGNEYTRTVAKIVEIQAILDGAT